MSGFLPKRHRDKEEYEDEQDTDRGHKIQHGFQKKDSDRSDSSNVMADKHSNQGENEHKENNQE